MDNLNDPYAVTMRVTIDDISHYTYEVVDFEETVIDGNVIRRPRRARVSIEADIDSMGAIFRSVDR